MREIYVISDLHLGGLQPSTSDPDDRGFRICTHSADVARFIRAVADKPQPVELIVNGDLVDFLAEADEGGSWAAFTANQDAAVRKLDAIVERDRAVFEAFHQLLGRGHRLCLLPGNHDIELTLPAVRRRLRECLGVRGSHDFQFIYDGEAYQVGRALIEHGNRYDKFNVVDHDGLRRVRSMLSRNQSVPVEYEFAAPAGSHIVSSVMNEIKAQYKFIDLLKPETAAAIPFLLAVEPGFRQRLMRLAGLAARAQKHGLQGPALPAFAGDMAASGGALATAGIGEDIGARDYIDRGVGLASLLSSGADQEIDARLPALLQAVRALQTDQSFDRDRESCAEYRDAAEALASRGFDYIVFGHTHLARDMALARGGRYLNSGTWADVIRFPCEILSGSRDQALDGLKGFVEDLRHGRLAAWTSFIPTYVKLVLDADGQLRDAGLCDYLPTAMI